MKSINVPLTGFGTWKLHEPKLSPAIREAIRVGYRHFDGAAIYENQAQLGKVFDKLINQDRAVVRSDVHALAFSCINTNISIFKFIAYSSCLLLQNFG